jgi:hypothetical protein
MEKLPDDGNLSPELIDAEEEIYKLARLLIELDHWFEIGLVLARSFTTSSQTNPPTGKIIERFYDLAWARWSLRFLLVLWHRFGQKLIDSLQQFELRFCILFVAVLDDFLKLNPEELNVEFITSFVNLGLTHALIHAKPMPIFRNGSWVIIFARNQIFQ